MRNFLITAMAVCIVSAAFGQRDSTRSQKDSTQPQHHILKPNHLPRSNDHLMFQVGYTTWQGKPDSIKTTGIPRTFNVYFLFDFPFKTNPHWSVALGPGISTDNIYFQKTYVGIKDNTARIAFTNQSDTNFFKKNKLVTTYLEAPVELRYATKPDDNKHSIKIAAGAKIATLLSAHTKGKTLENKSGGVLIPYIFKENSKRFFNTTRLSLTGRLGYGNFSLFASYAVTPLFKEGLGPVVRPVTIGLTLSGL